MILKMYPFSRCIKMYISPLVVSSYFLLYQYCDKHLLHTFYAHLWLFWDKLLEVKLLIQDQWVRTFKSYSCGYFTKSLSRNALWIFLNFPAPQAPQQYNPSVLLLQIPFSIPAAQVQALLSPTLAVGRTSLSPGPAPQLPFPPPPPHLFLYLHLHLLFNLDNFSF